MSRVRQAEDRYRMNTEESKELLLSLPEVRRELDDWRGGNI